MIMIQTIPLVDQNRIPFCFMIRNKVEPLTTPLIYVPCFEVVAEKQNFKRLNRDCVHF